MDKNIKYILVGAGALLSVLVTYKAIDVAVDDYRIKQAVEALKPTVADQMKETEDYIDRMHKLGYK